MSRFQDTFPNFADFEDAEFHKRSVPPLLVDALAKRLEAACRRDGDNGGVRRLEAMVNEFLTSAGKRPTTNWEFEALAAELKASLRVAEEAGFPRFMDALLKAVQRVTSEVNAQSAAELLPDLNSDLLDHRFGYTLEKDAAGVLTWQGRTSAQVGVDAVDEASEALLAFPLALEHLKQARAHLLSPDKSRSVKDALRDAMSALESLLKSVAKEDDIERATKRLRDDGRWGLPEIVKDGLSIWNHLHRLYPDVRHGQGAGTNIELQEALYWMERIFTFAKYIVARKRSLGA